MFLAVAACALTGPLLFLGAGHATSRPRATVATGRYPARDQLLRYASLASVAAPAGAAELG